MLQASQLFIYPIKSLCGISLRSAKLTDRGFQHDRRFLLVDDNNHFLTQRIFPAMALLHTAIEDDRLIVFHKDAFEDKLTLPLIPERVKQHITVSIWEDDCKAQPLSKEVDEWFSSKLKTGCRLVYMPDSAQRAVDKKYSLNNDIVNFADGYPLLAVGQASIDDLNRRLPEPVSVTRFRPNIVFTGGVAYEEDRMAHFRINDLNFYGVKPSARCVVITIDPETGISGKEPLTTLATYRSKNNKVYFGQNVLMRGEGKIKLGDTIEIVERD